jgi:hypothetical protein
LASRPMLWIRDSYPLRDRYRSMHIACASWNRNIDKLYHAQGIIGKSCKIYKDLGLMAC